MPGGSLLLPAHAFVAAAFDEDARLTMAEGFLRPGVVET
jgi:hypothetical protein